MSFLKLFFLFVIQLIEKTQKRVQRINIYIKIRSSEREEIFKMIFEQYHCM